MRHTDNGIAYYLTVHGEKDSLTFVPGSVGAQQWIKNNYALWSTARRLSFRSSRFPAAPLFVDIPMGATPVFFIRCVGRIVKGVDEGIHSRFYNVGWQFGNVQHLVELTDGLVTRVYTREEK